MATSQAGPFRRLRPHVPDSFVEVVPHSLHCAYHRRDSAVPRGGYTVRERRDLARGACQLVTDQGPIVNVFDTGIVQVEGQDKAELEAKLAARSRRP
jgi:hypothetical protein